MIKDPVIKLTLPYPPSVNKLRKPGRVKGISRLINTKYVKQYYFDCLAIHGRCSNPIKNKIAMYVFVYPPNNRGDMMNLEKIVSDSLGRKNLNVFYDDRQIWEAHWYRRKVLKDDPKIKIVIYEIADIELEAIQQEEVE